MERSESIRKHFEASVAQGLGSWAEQSEDPVLGTAVFSWSGEPTVQVFEDGFIYSGKPALKLRYDELVGLDLLDLRSLMKAQKAPKESVEFAVTTSEGRHALLVPLFLYTTLSGLLNAMLDGR